MTKQAFKGGCRITCEISGCRQSFLSYSMASWTRRQAFGIGWRRITLDMLDGWKSRELGSNGKRKLDACPAHAMAIAADHAERVGAEKIAKAQTKTIAASNASTAARIKRPRQTKTTKKQTGGDPAPAIMAASG